MGKSYVELFNGEKMPLVGLGTWQATNPEDLENALNTALKAGYRHIDTAYMYTNEAVIGKVLKEWLDSGRVKREELYIVTKLPPIGMRPKHVPHFMEKSLKNLQLDYVDLYLVHLPVGLHYSNDTDLFPKNETGGFNYDLTTDLEAIWGAMEDQVTRGLTKSIGVSNFSISQIERIMKVARIQPANNQVELHAYYQQKDLQEACKKHNITICAYAPIGSPGRVEIYKMFGRNFEPLPLMEEPAVVKAASNHNKTPAQVLLRFLTQKDIIVIPKSTNPGRVVQNFEVLDFDLTDSEIKSLESLDKGSAGKSFGGFPGAENHPESPDYKK